MNKLSEYDYEEQPSSFITKKQELDDAIENGGSNTDQDTFISTAHDGMYNSIDGITNPCYIKVPDGKKTAILDACEYNYYYIPSSVEKIIVPSQKYCNVVGFKPLYIDGRFTLDTTGTACTTSDAYYKNHDGSNMAFSGYNGMLYMLNPISTLIKDTSTDSYKFSYDGLNNYCPMLNGDNIHLYSNNLYKNESNTVVIISNQKISQMHLFYIDSYRKYTESGSNVVCTLEISDDELNNSERRNTISSMYQTEMNDNLYYYLFNINEMNNLIRTDYFNLSLKTDSTVIKIGSERSNNNQFYYFQNSYCGDETDPEPTINIDYISNKEIVFGNVFNGEEISSHRFTEKPTTDTVDTVIKNRLFTSNMIYEEPQE